MLAAFSSKGSDSKYFSTQKKGEIHELRSELNSTNKDKVKSAVKKVIASMTVGKDVSSLFTDVVKLMQTDNIELKKLIYLYIINYARSQPEKAILVVNSFQKDSGDENPLIRALAIRTMGCIRVDSITEFLCDPLQARLKDKDPYVRKTAAVCVAKLYDVNAELVEEQGLLDTLRDLIGDSNHTVVANAVAALSEISELSGKDQFMMDSDMLFRLLTAMDSCSEWGQVSILDALCNYTPTNTTEAEDVLERVSPRLKHANCAVSMAAVKNILHFVKFITNESFVEVLLHQKLPTSLVTLVSDPRPEVQYVALRNIALIVQEYPVILSGSVKNFFCKYNDPIYVKLEKLEILVSLINIDNIDKVLREFQEYAQEADVDFVRRSIRAIGRCAIKLPEATDKCITILLNLIGNKVNYVVQESIVVIKNIFRRYPNEYESIISELCNNLDTLDEPDAKASMIWIIGEYCERIDNAAELLEGWLETFLDEPVTVQLQLLTAIVKLFLKVPAEGKDIVTAVLTLATKKVDNPDLRDRGFIYWRLLSENPDVALKVVLAQKSQIEDDTTTIDKSVLRMLLSHVGTLAAVYHKNPESFVKSAVGAMPRMLEEEEDEHEAMNSNDVEEEVSAPQQTSNQNHVPLDIFSGLDLLNTPAAPQQQQQQTSAPAAAAAPIDDVFALLGLGDGIGSVNSAPAPVKELPLLTTTASNIEIRGEVRTQGGKPSIHFVFKNNGHVSLQSIPVKFNANGLNLAPKGALSVNLTPGSTVTADLPLIYSAPNLTPIAGKKLTTLQIALKLDAVAYVSLEVGLETCFDNQGLLETQQWLQKWQALQDMVTSHVSTFADENTIISKLAQHNMKNLATRNINGATHLFVASIWRTQHVLFELILSSGNVTIQAKSEDRQHSEQAAQALASILA